MDDIEAVDFIIIGAGPAGCAVASRLSEDTSTQVVLIEAGPDRRGFLGTCAMAGAVVFVPRKGSNNWGFQTVSDPGLNHRRDFHSLGRGLGGGSSINTLMYVRGNPRDYDDWAALGNPGWGYADVLPYFVKTENNQYFRGERANRYHGTDGPVCVENLRTDNPWHARLIAACAERGWPHNPDYNGATQEGVSPVQVMMKNGERHHAGNAYILPHVAERPNLRLHCETDCTRILFEGKRAVGVELIHQGQRRTLRARKEIIVSAGGILSAKLLLISGVGPGVELHAHGIVQVHESPAVGQHLHDHIDAILGYHIPLDPNLLGVSPVGGVNLWKAWRRWQRERRGMLCTNFAEVTGFHSLHADSPKPEIQYEFVIALAMDHGRDIYWKHGMSCHVLILHPKSRGSVTLASPRWQDDPVIDFRYFSHLQDLDDLAEGARRVHEVFWNTSLRQHIKTDLLTAKCKTQDDWKEFCRNASGTGYHPVGSCRMGPDPADNVVDARLRVHGMEHLRVIDSSIMPNVCGGNTTAPSYMIGEKGADMIKEDWT